MCFAQCFSCSNYVKDYRGSCQHRHYVRAEAIEQIVTMELKKLAGYLKNNEDELVKHNLLCRKYQGKGKPTKLYVLTVPKISVEPP